MRAVSTETDPDLARLMDWLVGAWPDLPGAVRARLLAFMPETLKKKPAVRSHHEACSADLLVGTAVGFRPKDVPRGGDA